MASRERAWERQELIRQLLAVRPQIEIYTKDRPGHRPPEGGQLLHITERRLRQQMEAIPLHDGSLRRTTPITQYRTLETSSGIPGLGRQWLKPGHASP
jgi:hypothetical protein